MTSDTRETLFLIFSGISTRRFLVRTTLFTISIGPILFSLEGPTRAERGFETHSPHSFLFFSTPPPPPLPLHISRMRICDEGRTKGESTASWKAHTKIESATSIAYTIRESCVKARPTDVGRAFICNVAGRSHDAAAYAPTRLYSSRYASNRISFQTMCVTIVIVDLSLFGFRVQSRDDLKGMKTWRRRWCFEKVGVWWEKSFFFTWNYSRKWTRVVERRLLLPMVNEETLQSFVYFSFFSRIRRLQNFSVRNFVQKRLGGKRFERTRFRSPVDERSRNNRDKQIIRAATTQWNNVQPRSATDESISTLFSLRKASILEKCSYL